MTPDDIRLFDAPLRDLVDEPFPRDSLLAKEGVIERIVDSGVDAAWQHLGATTGMDRAMRVVIRRAADLWVVVEESADFAEGSWTAWAAWGFWVYNRHPELPPPLAIVFDDTVVEWLAPMQWAALEPFVTAPVDEARARLAADLAAPAWYEQQGSAR